MEVILGALIIFFLRICDVSVGTMRVVFTVRGARWQASALGFVEAAIWLLAVRQVLDQLGSAWNILGYGGGFAAGTFIGITIERWIGSGWVLLRVISKEQAESIRQRLHAAHFGVTSVDGRGMTGRNEVLFIVATRRRGSEALRLVQEVDERAFVTIDSVTRAGGGFLPHVAPSGVRK